MSSEELQELREKLELILSSRCYNEELSHPEEEEFVCECTCPWSMTEEELIDWFLEDET